MIEQAVRRLEKITRTDVRYLGRGIFWFGAQHGASIIGALAVSVIFANLLPKEVYGTYRYILSIFSILMISTVGRMDDSLAISVARGFEGNFLEAMMTRMRWGLWGSIAGLILSGYWFYAGNTELATVGLLVALFVPLFETPTIYNGFLIGKKKFKEMSYLTIVNNILYSVAIVGVVLATKKVFWIVFWYLIINTAIRLFTLWYVLLTEHPNTQKDERTLSYGKKLSVIDALGVFSDNIDSILLFHYLGPVGVAAYNFITKVPEQMKFIPKYITALSTPKYSTKDISDSAMKWETMHKTLFLFLTLLSAAIVYIVAAPSIFHLLFRPYEEYVWLSQIYAISMPLNFAGLAFNFLESSRKEHLVLTLNTLTPTLQIIMIFVTVKFFGLTGLVFGFVGIKLVINLIRLAFFWVA